MKQILGLLLACTVLGGCVEDPNQAALEQMYRERGITGYEQPTTLEDVNNSIHDLQDQERDAARQAELDAAETRLHQDLNNSQ